MQEYVTKDSGNSRFIMFTGEPGTWKSTTALSYPKNQYWFQFDKKISSLLIPARNWNIDLSQVDYDNYTDWNSARQKLEAFQGNPVNKKGERYKTIIIDSITTMAEATNLQTLRTKSGTTNRDGGEKGMRIGGIAVNSLEDYKAEKSAFTQSISMLKDIQDFFNINVILIAHLQGEHDAQKASSRMIITGGKAISGMLPAYCEEVYYFGIEKSMDTSKPPTRYISTIHTGNDFARTTLPLPNKIQLEASKPLYDSYIVPAMEKLKG